MHALVSNEKGFARIPKLTVMMREARKAAKRVFPRSSFFDAGPDQRSKAAIDAGVETVVYTLASYNLLYELPKAENLVVVHRLCTEVRLHFKKHGVPLSEELENLIASFEAGEYTPEAWATCLKDLEKKPTSPPDAPVPPAPASGTPASDAPTPAAPASEPSTSDAAAPAAPASAPSASDAPGTEAVAAPEAPDPVFATPKPKRRKLADKLQNN